MRNDLELTDLEMAVIVEMIKKLPGDREVLLQQLENCKVISRKNTGHGCYTTLKVDRNISPSKSKERDMIQGVHLACPELVNGAGFILYVEDGYLDTLEGYTYVDDQWPEKVSAFQVSSSEGNQ